MIRLLKFIFIFICSTSFAQQSGAFSIYLLGDGGEDVAPGKALTMLQERLLADSNSAVIFLGDNVYPSGLNLKKPSTILHLESQLQILKEYRGKVYFIPGNHDWDAQKKNGVKKVKVQEEYVEQYIKTKTTVANKDSSTFLPKNGFPGPETVMLTDKLRLIIIDTQWFLHFFKKGKNGTKKRTAEVFYKQLDSLLSIAKTNKEQVVIAAHHPIYTNGQHSRAKQPWRFLVNRTPLQFFGLMGVNRLYSQDINQPRYKRMSKRMLEVLDKYDNVTFVSGHEHNIQCFKEHKNRYIVSGSGSKLSRLSRRRRFLPIFEDDKKTGFVKIDYLQGKYISTTVYRSGEPAKVLEGY